MIFRGVLKVEQLENGRGRVTLWCQHTFDCSPLLIASFRRTQDREGKALCTECRPRVIEPVEQSTSSAPSPQPESTSSSTTSESSTPTDAGATSSPSEPNGPTS